MCGQQVSVEFQPLQEARPVSENQRLGEQLLVVAQQNRTLRLAEQHLRAQWLRGRRAGGSVDCGLRLRAIELSIAAAVGARGRRRGRSQRVTERTQRLRRNALLE